MSSLRPKKVVFKPQSRRPGSSHKGDTIQKWDIIDMRNALVFYFCTRAPGYTGKKYGYKTIADSYHVPRETFRRRLSGPLMGYFGHIAGGKHCPQNFVNTAHPNLLITPIHLALPNSIGAPFATVQLPVAAAASVPAPAAAASVPALAAAASVPAPAPVDPAPVTTEKGKQNFYFLFYISDHM